MKLLSTPAQRHSFIKPHRISLWQTAMHCDTQTVKDNMYTAYLYLQLQRGTHIS